MSPSDSARPSASPGRCIHIQILEPDAAPGPVRMGWLLGLAEKIDITYFYPQLCLHYLYIIAIFSYTHDTCQTRSTLDCVNDDHYLPVKV